MRRLTDCVSFDDGEMHYYVEHRSTGLSQVYAISMREYMIQSGHETQSTPFQLMLFPKEKEMALNYYYEFPYASCNST